MTKFPKRPGESDKQATDRFTKEVQRRLDGKPGRLSNREEEAAVQAFVKDAVKNVQKQLKGKR